MTFAQYTEVFSNGENSVQVPKIRIKGVNNSSLIKVLPKPILKSTLQISDRQRFDANVTENQNKLW